MEDDIGAFSMWLQVEAENVPALLNVLAVLQRDIAERPDVRESMGGLDDARWRMAMIRRSQ